MSCDLARRLRIASCIMSLCIERWNGVVAVGNLNTSYRAKVSPRYRCGYGVSSAIR